MQGCLTAGISRLTCPWFENMFGACYVFKVSSRVLRLFRLRQDMKQYHEGGKDEEGIKD